LANAILHDVTERPSLPPSFAPSALAEIVVVSDFWSPMPEVRATLSQLSATGAHGHTVQIVDPAEETFPYSGPRRVHRAGRRPVPSPPAAPKPGRPSTTRVLRATGRDQGRDRSARLELHDPPATDRPATELLLALHARLGAPPPGAMIGGRLSAANPGRQA